METRSSGKTQLCLLIALAMTSAACGEDEDKTERDASASQVADAGGAGAGDASVASTSRVTIDDGELVGKVDDGVHKFLGIPYAKPPIGALRWKRPVKNDKWTTAREAGQFGKRCAQLASTVLQNAASEDEDCLYLNVWSSDVAAKQPVMVWIHGGGNVNGSASEPVPFAGAGLFYSGIPLAKKGVVVVTLNYRLGVLGFLAHPELSKEPDGLAGNQGLFDQTAALTWVKDNIAKFGGDPGNVTIFGESAGSLDVCFHVASPKSRGLFQRAISQSGGCTTRNATLADGQTSAAGLASAFGCTGEGQLTCLREKPVKDLLKPPVTAAPLSFGPVVDGELLPEQARALYDRGDIAKVPYILGSNTDEGTLFVPSTLMLETEADLRAAITLAFPTADATAILAVYPLANFTTSAMKKPARLAYERIVGDARLVCSTYDSAVRAAAANLPVWIYNFDVPVTVAGTELGATHGAELASVFGTSPNFTAETRAVSARMQTYWTNFAKTGDPNGGSELAWGKLTATDNVRLNFGLQSTVVNGFRASECALWRAGYEKAFATP